ncbi:MAG: DUF1153 domain-containing protein [Rhodospirillales bacterium]|nr:DUF1153 domain-containing protein [Rhodospirillales bacterium]
MASAMINSKHPPSTSAEPDLPPSNTVRWVVRRKARVVAAVQDGLITLEEVCARYALSVEEFLAWERGLKQHGVDGLRARVRQHT